MKEKIFFCFGLFIFGMAAGVLFQKQIGLWKLKMALYDLAPLSWTRDEVAIDSLPKEGLMVALAFGQSNSANYGQGRRRARERVFNYFQGTLYHAEDPMLAADGNGASVWPRLGDLLIDANYYDAVVFATIGINSSKISRWQPGGDLHSTLLSTLRSLKQSGLTVTHLLWHQGESDAVHATSGEDYQTSFNRMLTAIREHGVDASLFLSIATRYQNHPQNRAIRMAQLELALSDPTISSGPDSDRLGDDFRRDGTHFTSTGLDRLAQLWLERLVKARIQ